MRILLLLLLTSFFTAPLLAQRNCASYDYEQQLIIRGEINNEPVLTGRLRDTTPNEIITIPVVIHLIYNTNQQNISDAQVKSQLDALNKDYRKLNLDAANVPAAFKSRAADTRIQFCLAQVDPKGRATTGIIRKYTSKEFFMGDDAMKFTSAGGDDSWNSQEYLNIWVCNLFGNSLGYATMPGAPANKDGLVIKWNVFGTTGVVSAPFNKGRTATHEVAHWLGLKHIWGDDICGSDDVEDTPPQKSYNFYCPTFPKVSNCSIDGNGDMFMNFMDLTDDGCMNMFTHGQAKKMRGIFSRNGARNSFLYSARCDSSLATTTTGGPLPLPTDTLARVVETVQPSLHVYPNPVGNYLNIVPQNNFQIEGKDCNIFNIQGKKVYSQKITSQKESINVSQLTPGVYFLKIGEGAEKKMYKMIKI